MKGKLLGKVSLALHQTAFALRKHSPEILVATGIAGAVVSAVLACKATRKLDDILEPAMSDIEKIHQAAEDGYISSVSNPDTKVEYTREDSLKDLTITYARTGVKLVRLYAPALSVGAVSIGAILASHDILRKRGAALAAAYTAVDRSFKLYRSHVVERFGERVDKEMKYGVKAVEVEESVTGEDGTEEKVKKTVDAVEPFLFPPDGHSEYAMFFDENAKGWEPDHDYNLMFLRAQQQYANDRLKTRGYLFLNEVYEELGIPKTKTGQVVGWIYDPKNSVGDNFVDFGMTEVRVPRDGAYIERILLDFNVDGPIMERVKW